MSLRDDPALEDDGTYELFALPYARQAKRSVADAFMATSLVQSADLHDRNMAMFFYVWIARNKSRTVIIDSGFGEQAALKRGRPLAFNPVDALARIGIDPAAVEDVIITHLHYDHAGNIDRFPNADLHVQAAEAAFATGPCMCEQFMRAPYDVEDVVTLVRRLYADRVRFHDGDTTPLPGISLYRLPGHSAGLQAVGVMTPRGLVLLASDASHYYVNFLRRIPFRLTIDVAATHRSYSRLVEVAGSVDRVIPGHDPKVHALYPKRVVNGVELVVLHEPPRPHDAEELLRIGD